METYTIHAAQLMYAIGSPQYVCCNRQAPRVDIHRQCSAIPGRVFLEQPIPSFTPPPMYFCVSF